MGFDDLRREAGQRQRLQTLHYEIGSKLNRQLEQFYTNGLPTILNLVRDDVTIHGLVLDIEVSPPMKYRRPPPQDIRTDWDCVNLAWPESERSHKFAAIATRDASGKCSIYGFTHFRFKPGVGPDSYELKCNQFTDSESEQPLLTFWNFPLGSFDIRQGEPPIPVLVGRWHGKWGYGDVDRYRWPVFLWRGEQDNKKVAQAVVAVVSGGEIPRGDVRYWKDGSRCFIASAAYGSDCADEVMILRRFRDESLRQTLTGRALVAIYEVLSPPLAAFLKQHSLVASLVRRFMLTPLLLLLRSLMNSTSTGPLR